MVAQHTPGPWEARSFHVHVEGKGLVASVPNPWNDERERQANTRLIAAAPTLLEALEALLEASECHIFSDECVGERDAARAAINSAKGAA